MGYTSRHLAPGEKILYTGKISKAIFIGPVIAIVIAAVSAVYAVMLTLEHEFEIECLFAVAAFFGLYGLFNLVSKLFLVLTSEFTITDKRCILKKGFVSITVSDIALDKCEGMIFKQSIIGRIFGFGTIGATTGGSDQKFSGLDKPFDFRNKLFLAMDEAKSRRYAEVHSRS